MGEYRHLRHFVEVAERLHMTAAAERLHIAQPALSQSIRALEEDLGVTLFLREKKRLVLTDAGRAFLPEARKSIEQFEHAKTVAKKAQRGEVGEFAIGFGVTAGFGILPGVLRRFRRAYPNVSLLLRELGTDGQLAGLENGELDVALGYTRADEAKFGVRLLRPERLVVILPAHHVLARKRSISIDDLRNEPLILPRRAAAGSVSDAVSALYAARNLEPRLSHRVETPQTAYALVTAGLGVSITTPSTLAFSSGAIAERPLRDPHPPVQLNVFWRKDDNSPILANFLALVGTSGKTASGAA